MPPRHFERPNKTAWLMVVVVGSALSRSISSTCLRDREQNSKWGHLQCVMREGGRGKDRYTAKNRVSAEVA